MSSNELLAKSIENGGLTLLQHTTHVVAAIEKFAAELGFDVALARKGAILHDLGKGHPHFQHKISGAKPKTMLEMRELNMVCHRHEISSLGFLPIFPKEDWDNLIDLVVAHHKSVKNDPTERGLLDLADSDPDFIDFHLLDWDLWSPAALSVAQQLGISTQPIAATQAKHAIEYAISYCTHRPKGWSPLKGLLRGADHFGSAFTHQVDDVLLRTFKSPDLSWFSSPIRQNSLYPLSTTTSIDPRAHTLVVAPTGAGKTDFLLRRCQGRVFYTLPFQASINAMFDRIKLAVPDADVRLLHSTSRLKVGHNWVEQTLQPLIGASVKVLTPHQIASIIFGTSGYETVMLDLRGADVILDEIHTYSDWSGAMVREIVRALLRLDCKVHIGTATIPTALYQQMFDLLGGSGQVYEVRLPTEILDSFNRHIVYREPNTPDQIVNILQNAFSNHERVLLVHNTVKDAQSSYQALKQVFPEVPIMLIHSRFRRKDRVHLESLLTTHFNNRTLPEFAPCLVISTQVVEVSLDISFDRMITACAPLDSLIQRFGRVNRYRDQSTIGRFKPVHVLAPEGSGKPYDSSILKASFEQLPHGDLLQERHIQSMIDAVYPTVESKQIDVHLIYKESIGYVMPELIHRPKSIIVEALEIESASCILESDRLLYETGTSEQRIELEIPIPWSTIRWQTSKYVQLENIGSWPFVIPQPEEIHQELGLILTQPDRML